MVHAMHPDKGGKVHYASCNTYVYPKMVFRHSKPSSTVCPFCANRLRDFMLPSYRWMQENMGWVMAIMFAVIYGLFYFTRV